MGADKTPRAAYVVDVDEDGRAIRGSRRTASTREKEKPKVLAQRDRDAARPDNNKSSSKRRTRGDPDRDRRDHRERAAAADRPATSRGEREEARRDLEVITTTSSDRDVKPLERRKSTSSNTLSPQKITRPPSAHKNRSFPRPPEIETRRDDPSHFGLPSTPTSRALPIPIPIVSQQPFPPAAMPQPIPVRPRAVTAQTYPNRPLSYHATYNSAGGYGPPLSASAWTNYQPTQQVVATGYPTPGGYPPPRYAATPAPPTSDYFGSMAMSAPDRPMSARPLAARFEAPPRTMSGFGNRDPRSYEPSTYGSEYHDDGYASASEGTIRRRESIRKPSKAPTRRTNKIEADSIAMPPPPRPSILRRPVTDYPTEPVEHYREGRSLIRDDSRPRQSSSRRTSVTYDLGYERDSSRPRRPATDRKSASYDHVADAPERVRIETANNGRRRQSYYGQSASASGSSGYEDKIRQAANYQEDVAGPSIPLTTEVLKRQQRRQAGSSRSTKSSNSRDESDYRKSATTRTTRSGSGDDENVTIKVIGTARVMVGGAQIDCPDGGEIEIKRQPKALRNGSEISASEYGGQAQIDDRRSRVDRPSGKSRLSSQHSYTRSTQCFGDNYF